MSDHDPNTPEEQRHLVEDAARRMDAVMREALGALARGDYEEITPEEMDRADFK